MDEKEKKEEKRVENIKNAGVAGAAGETVQRYGAAAKQHYVAYSGKDNEAGKELTKGLKKISSSKKTAPEYKFQNDHQKAGFAAETKDTARTNAENIINKKKERKTRTDDIGRVNDPLYDSVMLDANGNVIENSGAQMKFIGASKSDPKGEGNAARALDKLQSQKFQKYLDANAKIEVPSDQYDKILQEADKRIDALKKQLDNQRKAGNSEQVKVIQEKIDKLKKIKKNLRKSTVSTNEAMLAALHPELSTAIDVAKISHRAGIEAAKTSALIGGSVSIVKNIVQVCKDEEEPDDAIKNVARDTATTIGVGYATGFTGAALKGAMQNSKSQYVRVLSKTNLAATLASVTISATSTLSQYFNEEINGVECMEALGEEGAGMIASAMFAQIGEKAIGDAIVGGLVGGMLGYTLASVTYSILTGALKEAKMAKEERVQIEQICQEHINMIREYRRETENIINEYLSDSSEIFRESFSGVKNALAIGDVDWVIESANTITESFGGQALFSDMNDFENKMINKHTFVL